MLFIIHIANRKRYTKESTEKNYTSAGHLEGERTGVNQVAFVYRQEEERKCICKGTDS